MSMETTCWALKQNLPPVAKLLLIHLADGHSWDNGEYGEDEECWNIRSVHSAAGFCGISCEDVCDQLQVLEEFNLLEWVQETGDVHLFVPHVPRSLPSRSNISPKLRTYVFMRDGFRCRYCGENVTLAKGHLEHVIPVSQGGEDTKENLVASCRSCNHKKGPRTPEEAEMTLLPNRMGVTS